MFKEKIENLGKHEGNNKKKIENTIVLIIILIVTIVFINIILKGDTISTKNNEKTEDSLKKLAEDTKENTLEENLEAILSSIKGVGEVRVFINYQESSKTVAMYDERTVVSTTEENDSAGGIRNTTSTETQKDVIFSDSNGGKVPVTEKIIMPIIEGAIITAKGASNANIKSNIVSAVKAATGLSIDKIQVFEMK